MGFHFNRFQRCRGLALRLFRWQVEFWLCPSREVIPSHSHPDIDSYVLALAGKMRWTVGPKTCEVSWPLRRRSNGQIGVSGHAVLRGQTHGAEVVGRFGLFVVFQHWFAPATSAAVNFQAT